VRQRTEARTSFVFLTPVCSQTGHPIANMAPAFKCDQGSGNSIDEEDFFGTHGVRGANDNPAGRPENETNVIRDGNDVILKQFEMKMIKREYSRNQTSRDKKVSAAGAMTLAGVDWSGFPGAAHISPLGDTPFVERKSPRDRRRKSLHSGDEEVILVPQRHRHRPDGHGSSRFPVSQRRLSAGDAPRALSADSALSPRPMSPQHRNRRTSKRNLSVQTPDTGAVFRPSSSRSSRRMSLDLEGSNNIGNISHGGSGSGSGSRSGHRPLRTRRAASGERVERQQRPRSEKNVSSRRPQRQNSSGAGAKRSPRTSNRNTRSESPSNAGRRNSMSPHASTRGLAAASATTLDTRRKSTSQSKSRRGSSLEKGNGDFMGIELKKQSSIRW
jgi:hypothetical protein